MSEVKKCPKCEGEMEVGHLDRTYYWNRGTNYYRIRHGPRIWGYACKDCGSADFYVEKEVLRHE